LFYLINTASDLTFSEQIAIADTTVYLKTAQGWADSRKAQTGDDWEVVQIKGVYTTQTLDEAMEEIQ
jgi:hypothetical protein